MRGLIAVAALALAGAAPKPMGTAEVLKSATAADWRPIAPDNLLVMQLPKGRVLIELAPAFSPKHVANVRTLAREHWFDGTTINRVQENYVVQWGDATEKKPLGSGVKTLAAEFDVPAKGLKFTPLPGPATGYGREGYVDSWPVARKSGRVWPAHCYGMMGAGRNDTADSGPGSELYVVIGQAPRHLDRNSPPLGRVIEGMELLTTLPRGSDGLGMYDRAEQRVPITSIRLASELPEAQRPRMEVLRTDTATWRAWVDARSHRSRDGWFVNDAGYADLCNIRVPVREAH